MARTTYAAAEKFILSREFFGMKLGLANISRFLASLGSPQKQYKTVHISGTNGKGSTAAMLASILTTAGYRTGLFTSPHLVDLRERIQIDGAKISKKAVAEFIARHRQYLSIEKLSFFETVTAMAFDYFARTKVDIAIVEVGLGGRLDATNTLQPILTITTDISIDHVENLGGSIASIAREKAGIVHPRVPHLVGLLPKQAMTVFRDSCKNNEAPMHTLDRKQIKDIGSANSFDYQLNGYRLSKLKLSLLGQHQRRNALLVLNAIAHLTENGFKVGSRAIRTGLANTDWPGRFQIINTDQQPTVILDVAHNESGVKAFVRYFKRIYPRRRAAIISGFVQRKQHQQMIDSLATIGSSISLVSLRTGRTTDTRKLAGKINFRGMPMSTKANLSTAYRDLLKQSVSDDIIIVIGSHYLVGEFLSKFGKT